MGWDGEQAFNDTSYHHDQAWISPSVWMMGFTNLSQLLLAIMSPNHSNSRRRGAADNMMKYIPPLHRSDVTFADVTTTEYTNQSLNTQKSER